MKIQISHPIVSMLALTLTLTALASQPLWASDPDPANGNGEEETEVHVEGEAKKLTSTTFLNMSRKKDQTAAVFLERALKVTEERIPTTSLDHGHEIQGNRHDLGLFVHWFFSERFTEYRDYFPQLSPEAQATLIGILQPEIIRELDLTQLQLDHVAILQNDPILKHVTNEHDQARLKWRERIQPRVEVVDHETPSPTEVGIASVVKPASEEASTNAAHTEESVVKPASEEPVTNTARIEEGAAEIKKGVSGVLDETVQKATQFMSQAKEEVEKAGQKAASVGQSAAASVESVVNKENALKVVRAPFRACRRIWRALFIVEDVNGQQYSPPLKAKKATSSKPADPSLK